MINKYKILSFLSTLNFILPFIGYQLVTTIFILPKGDEFVESTQVVTIPYRAITLLVSLLLILLADKKTIKKPSLPIIAFFVYWLLLIFRTRARKPARDFLKACCTSLACPSRRSFPFHNLPISSATS